MRLIKLSILHLFGKKSRQNKLTILSVSDLISHARSFSDRVDRSEVPFPVPVDGRADAAAVGSSRVPRVWMGGSSSCQWRDSHVAQHHPQRAGGVDGAG